LSAAASTRADSDVATLACRPIGHGEHPRQRILIADGTSDSEATLDVPELGSRATFVAGSKIEELNMKLSTLLAAASIAALSLTTSAIAQNPAQQPAAPAARDAAAPAMNFKNAWRSSKLIGLNVYNRADEKLGDINEILL
jgi:hypothetical protein